MNCSDIDFRIKTASYKEILQYLYKCADSFKPQLYTYVDINKYAKKIYDYAITFEAWNGNILVGLAAVYFNNDVTKVGFCTNLSLLEEYQGSGIASTLAMNVKDYGKKNGFAHIVLEAKTNNSKAISFYQKHGFIISKENKDSLIMIYDINKKENR
jgi:ribosomal protein S18 acetylase RimI-like enzyme